jgi:chromosome segregation ATPase
MENLTTDFEQIDQELQELKSRFSRADIVLQKLEDIQFQFEHLADTYQKLKENITKASQFNNQSERVLEGIKQAQKDSEKYLVELKEKNYLQLDEINSRILELKGALDTHSTKIDKVESDVSTSQNDLNSHSSSIQSLQSRVEALTEHPALEGQNFEQISKRAGSISKEVDFLKEKHILLGKQVNVMKAAIVVLFSLNLFLIALVWQNRSSRADLQSIAVISLART